MVKIISVIIIFIFLTVPFTAFAQFRPASDIDTLAELKGIYFQITGADSFNGNEQKDISRIEKKIAHHMGKACIKVLPEKEYERLIRSQTYPFARIELSIDTFNIGKGEQNAYIVSIRAFQLIRLLRKPIIRAWASTWKEIKFVQGKDIRAIEISAMDLTDMFIKAYKSANP